MGFVKRYWIAGLVLSLVIIHAVIIGYVRSEATRIKVTASAEIPLGLYYVQSEDRNWLTQLRVHLLVTPERRIASKATIEHHRWQLHEAVEEKLRQLDPSLLRDAVLLEIKDQIKLAVEETLEEGIVEQVVVNDRIDIPIDHFDYQKPTDVTHPDSIYTSAPAADVDFDEIEK
ncbi:hypothetical protein [Aureliella helgolandensis]|uniref:Flagellar protein FliL n=1 Tax=Aureliella helgolandensis TaxID=2527968 RepID=A0A518GHA8_9BACT|nr:hypothetical protein [Aureliella helgolandensis]QDV27960.1 hypothetical protein Q31a_63530 [Aureliella helgolandensis]